MDEKTWAFKPLVTREHKPRRGELPKARSGHRIVCDEKYLYSFGGYNPYRDGYDETEHQVAYWTQPSSLLREIWKFNFLSGTWEKLPTHKDMPYGVASCAVVMLGQKIIVFGGTGVPFSNNRSNELRMFDLETGEMKTLPSRGSLPEPMYGQGMLLHDTYLYTVGGTSGHDYTCDIHRYDLTRHKWEKVYISCGRSLSEPRGRYRHEVAFDGRFIYVLGGGTADEAFEFAEIPAFDLKENQWTGVEALQDPACNAVPMARRCHGCVQYEDESSGDILVVISGGYTVYEEFSDMWRLNLRTRRWTCLATCSLPRPTYFHSVALTPQGKMYTFGGIIMKNGHYQSGTRTNAVYSTWLVIPKLQEICWEALNHYVKNLSRIPRDELAILGVPLQFLRRLETTNTQVPKILGRSQSCRSVKLSTTDL